MTKDRNKGFTLIELLIVVAIIGILAAIAIPNFLEAQVRAKVARVQSEFHSIGLALEMYCVDQDVYPVAQFPSGGPWVGPEHQSRLWPLTTPIEYLTSLPDMDPFCLDALAFYGQEFYEYKDYRSIYNDGNAWDWVAITYFKRVCGDPAWFICSRGPDSGFGYTWYLGGVASWEEAAAVYDSSNGTNSWGDIYGVSSSKASPILPDGDPRLEW